MRDVSAEAPLAIVPLKALSQAKGRLAPHLPARARRDLTGWMLARVVAACRDAQGVGDVLVVAGDDAAAGLARALDVEALVEPRPGLAGALATADRRVAGAAASLVVAADLPLVTARCIDELLGAAPDGPAVVVASSIDGGTGALLRRPATVMATSFGAGSAAAHMALARQAGIEAVHAHVPALALDVDDLSALRAAAAQQPALAAWLDARGLGLRAAAS